MTLPKGAVVDIETAEYVGGYKLRLVFSDERAHVVDFEPFLSSSLNPMIRKYLDPEVFANFRCGVRRFGVERLRPVLSDSGLVRSRGLGRTNSGAHSNPPPTHTPRRDAPRGIPAADGHHTAPTGRRHPCALPADQRDRQWPPRRHPCYGPAPVQVLRYVAGLLAEPPVALGFVPRPGDGRLGLDDDPAAAVGRGSRWCSSWSGFS